MTDAAAPLASIEAEQALLGALLLQNEVFDRVVNLVAADDFFDPVHGEIFKLVAGQIQQGAVVSPLTLKPFVEGWEGLSELGGVGYLVRMMGVANLFSAPDMARQVAEYRRRRDLVVVLEESLLAARNFDKPMDAITGAIEGFQLSAMNRDDGKIVTMRAAVTSAFRDVSLAYETGSVPGVKSGLRGVDDILGSLRKGNMIVLAGRPSMGKEQPVDRPVLTPRGWLPIGSLRSGDMVIGAAGKPVRVTAIFPQGVKQAFKVTFSDRTSTECGAEHLWSVAPDGGRSRTTFRTRPLKDLIAKGLCQPRGGRRGAKWRIPLVQPIEWPEAALPVDPYLIGVLLGDGSISGRDLRFSNPDMDRDIRDRVAAALPADISLRENRSGACPYFALTGPGASVLKATLRGLGLCVLSGTKFVPEVYLRGSAGQRLELLRGLMDTDGGCLGTSANFYTTASMLAAAVAELTRSLGGVASINTYDRTSDGKPIEYVVSVRLPVCPFHTARKAAAWSPENARLCRYMVSAEPSRMVEQVCISVEAEDGLYVTEDFIVTHNTAIALQIAMNAAREGHGVGFASREMTPEELALRAMSEATARAGRGVKYVDAIRGDVDETQMRALIAGAKDVAELPIRFMPPTTSTVGGVLASGRRLVRQFAAEGRSLDLLVLDYIQIMEAAQKNGRNEIVTEISGATKALARVLGIPVLALAQLSRGVESRDDKRPQLSDLRDSGAIEQDADVVMFCYREEYYLQRSRPQDHEHDKLQVWRDSIAACAGCVDLIVAKQRMGATGACRQWFDPATNWTRDIVRHGETDPRQPALEEWLG